jgi:hypothetical protein
VILRSWVLGDLMMGWDGDNDVMVSGGVLECIGMGMGGLRKLLFTW